MHALTWTLRLTSRPPLDRFHFSQLLKCEQRRRTYGWMKISRPNDNQHEFKPISLLVLVRFCNSPPILSALLLLTNSADSLLLELLFTFAKLMLLLLLLLAFEADSIISDTWFNCVWSLSCNLENWWMFIGWDMEYGKGIALPSVCYSESISIPFYQHRRPSEMVFLALAWSTMTTKRWNHWNSKQFYYTNEFG